MVGHFKNLLSGVVAAPQSRLSEIALLGQQERQQLLVEWNNTTADYPREKCIHELVVEQAAKTPDAIAIVFEDEQLSYGELDRRSNRLAHYLRERGVGPEKLVGLCVERSLEMVVGLLGILKAGGAYLPLEPSYPQDRLAYMLADAAPAVLLTQQHLSSTVPAGDIPTFYLDAQWLELTKQPLANPTPIGCPDNLAYVIYTSGSTGQPKGVMVERRGLQNLMRWYLDDLTLTDRDAVLLVSSFNFDLTQKNIFGPLLVGGRLHLTAEAFNPRALVRQIQRERITHINLSPSAFYALVDADSEAQFGSLKRVVLGGEPIQAAKLALLPEPRPDFINSYGPTECSDVVGWHPLSRDLERYQAAPIPLGKPVPKLHLYILDAAGQPVPIGVAGEIFVGGEGVARGYLNRPDMTAERFVPDPFSGKSGTRMYKTGNLARYLPDGNIEYLGRNDDQVKIRGFRIELGEIEAKWAKHEGVKEAVVMAREDVGGEKRLVAYYTAQDENAAPEAEGLRAHLQKQLPEHMVPAAYVRLDTLPLTPNGKLNRKALPAPGVDAYATRAYEAPQGEIETAIAGIWQQLLGLAQVGRHDDFFTLGGHSLLAMRVVARIREVLNVEVPVRTLFEVPTVRELGNIIDAMHFAIYRPSVPAAGDPIGRQQEEGII
jgi:amino acid adenylation domain-containing protein